MRIVERFPEEIKEIENFWITLPDGARLAARAWMPIAAEKNPVPAILEYIPYRKRDFTTARDEPMHRYFAGHGYAAVRVDLRGSGDSDGVLTDEYLAQELQDGVDVIAWLAAQPWCSGKLGMIGNSWGGFNALQIAALRPPALTAIITSCSTDNRYSDDQHYMGGCLLNDMLDWGTTFFALLPRTPDPVVSGDKWRQMWTDRLEGIAQPVEAWLKHQSYDQYWKHGSVSEDYAAITCAVFAVGGWLDGYSNAIPRMLANLSCPRLGLIGPWAHMYPHQAVPGPAIGFLQEALRFWDHWLKGLDTGIMGEPMLRAFCGDGVPARPYYETCPGQWIAEATWPSPNVRTERWGLSRGRLQSSASDKVDITWRSPQITGLASGEWCPYGTGGRGPEFPGDQREDDGKSLTFDSEPLTRNVEILGAPEIEVEVSVDRPTAFLVARLCDVGLDGTSTRVSYGVLNLCHHQSHERPIKLVPGERYKVSVTLNDAAYLFRTGHQIRLALSTTYWPLLWPSPEAVTLTLHCAGSWLNLPVRTTAAQSAAVSFEPPESGPPANHTMLRPVQWEQNTTHDINTGLMVFSALRNEGLKRLENNGLEIGTTMTERMVLREGDPLSAETTMTRIYEIGRADWRTRIEASAQLTCDAESFYLTSTLTAFEGDVKIFDRNWTRSFARNCV